MVGDKGKKTKVADAPEPEDQGELVISVEKLQEIQDELEKINEEASDKVLEVEQKYNEIRRPVYMKRNEVIHSIPDFWETAFLCHPVLGDLLTDEDHKVFKYLQSIDVEDFKDVKSGFSITFYFNPNPYFEDSKLTKTFSFSEEGMTNATCTEIKWKKGMDIANGGPPGKKGNKRPATEESFFSWFSESQQKNISDVNYDEIAEIIKDDLWPNPLKYFNNEADEDSGDEDGREKESDGEDEEDGEEEDDEDEEDGDEEEDS